VLAAEHPTSAKYTGYTLNSGQNLLPDTLQNNMKNNMRCWYKYGAHLNEPAANTGKRFQKRSLIIDIIVQSDINTVGVLSTRNERACQKPDNAAPSAAEPMAQCSQSGSAAR
jgi:hypothetical protein